MAFSSFVELFPCARGEGGDGRGIESVRFAGGTRRPREADAAGFGSNRARTMARGDLRGRRGCGKARGKCAANDRRAGRSAAPAAQMKTRKVLVGSAFRGVETVVFL